MSHFADDDTLALIKRLEQQLTAKDAKITVLQKAVDSVSDLISESYGVAGLHLNGDIAPWESLRTGGKFESWLISFDAAIEGGLK